MNRPWKRLALGLALLTMVLAMAVLATSSALAFTPGTDQPSSANANSPQNAAGALSRLAIRPASSEIFTANYQYTATAGVAGTSIIRTMYQQWRHDQQNDWFYLYARKVAPGPEAAGVGLGWAFFYYVPGRGATQIATGVANGTTVAAAAMTVSTIYLDVGTGTTNPAFLIDSLTASAPNCAAATTCTATFTSQLRWGLAAQGFRAGSMTLLQAVESFPIGTATIAQPTVYYDAWESPTGVANVVTLGDAAPTQVATDVTNATGTRQANLGVPYSMTQTVGDADGDLQSQSLIWVFASGPNMGNWFEAGVYNNRSGQGSSAAPATSGTGAPAAATAYYRDWRTAQTFFAVGSGTTVGYFTQLTVGAPAQTTTTLEGGAVGVTSQSVTYSFIYSTTAVGTLDVYGMAGDWHGRNSGLVLAGTQTVT